MSQSKQNTQLLNIQAQAIAQSLDLAFRQASAILNNLGINLYVYKIKLYIKESENNTPVDQDCVDPNLCIDWIVRLKCLSAEICRELKRAYLNIKGEQ
jgi:hypothetical protein